MGRILKNIHNALAGSALLAICVAAAFAMTFTFVPQENQPVTAQQVVLATNSVAFEAADSLGNNITNEQCSLDGVTVTSEASTNLVGYQNSPNPFNLAGKTLALKTSDTTPATLDVVTNTFVDNLNTADNVGTNSAAPTGAQQVIETSVAQASLVPVFCSGASSAGSGFTLGGSNLSTA